MKYHKHKSFIALVWCLLLGSSLAFSQRQISGVISDGENGEPLIGASVRAKGTTSGAVTDVEGKYRLAIPEGATQLEVTYTGYSSQILTIGASNVMDVALRPGLVLEETVVIGYGSVKKEDATGSVNAVTEKNFNRGAIVSPEQLVAGKVAGVQISSNSGEPGGQATIRVRGGTSVNASNEPLFVIDGVPIDNVAHNPGGFSNGRNPLNFLNPGDIETITVLKDASATAIYGSRGANGVIMITTKKGKKGTAGRLTYDGYYTTSSFAEEAPILDATAFRNVVTYVAPNRLEKLGDNNTNWFDEITQTATGQNHSVSFSGGAENVNYRVSAGYQKLEGVLRSSETERTSYSLNYGHSLFDNRLNINVGLKGSQTKDRFDPGQIFGAWTFDPTQPVYDRANTAFGGFFEYNASGSPRNPVSAYQQNQDYGKLFRNIASIDAEYKMDDFIKGLSAKLILGYDIQSGERKRFQPTTYVAPPGDELRRRTPGGKLYPHQSAARFLPELQKRIRRKSPHRPDGRLFVPGFPGHLSVLPRLQPDQRCVRPEQRHAPPKILKPIPAR
jgi:TonB-linked SusC/RagA family outer membrane protein